MAPVTAAATKLVVLAVTGEITPEEVIRAIQGVAARLHALSTRLERGDETSSAVPPN